MLTLRETAAFLKVSRSTCRDLWLKEGLPVVRLSSRTYRVDEEALREWVAKRTVPGWHVTAENGEPAQSTPSKAVRTGAFPSRATLTRLAGADAKSGSSARRRPPNATLPSSSAVSIEDYRPRKAQ